MSLTAGQMMIKGNRDSDIVHALQHKIVLVHWHELVEPRELASGRKPSDSIHGALRSLSCCSH